MLHFFNTFDNNNKNKIFNLNEVLKVYLFAMSKGDNVMIKNSFFVKTSKNSK